MSAEWPLILAYHHIGADAASRYVTPIGDFERQLHGLLERGGTPLSLEAALDAGRFERNDAAPKSFTLTFDDAFASFRTLALPALERLGITSSATVFVPTAFVGADNGWRSEPTLVQRLSKRDDPAEKLLSWDDLVELAAAGVAVESHGDRHVAMNRLAYDDARAEAERSRESLGAHGIDARYLAWPYGWFSAECARGVRDAGFEAALSVTHGGHDRYEIRRIPVYGTDGPVVSRLKASGRFFDAYDPAARLFGKRRAA